MTDDLDDVLRELDRYAHDDEEPNISWLIRSLVDVLADCRQRLEALESQFGGHNPSDGTGEQPEATATATEATATKETE